MAGGWTDASGDYHPSGVEDLIEWLNAPEEQQGEPVNYVQIEGDVDPSVTATTVSTRHSPPPDDGEARGVITHRDYEENEGWWWSVNYSDGKGFTVHVPNVVEAAIRAPLEERLLVAETLVEVRTRDLADAEARLATSDEMRRAAQAGEMRARAAAARLGRARWQEREARLAAEERIRELEAERDRISYSLPEILERAGNGEFLTGFWAQRLVESHNRAKAAEAENERLRELLGGWYHRREEWRHSSLEESDQAASAYERADEGLAEAYRALSAAALDGDDSE